MKFKTFMTREIAPDVIGEPLRRVNVEYIAHKCKERGYEFIQIFAPEGFVLCKKIK